MSQTMSLLDDLPSTFSSDSGIGILNSNFESKYSPYIRTCTPIQLIDGEPKRKGIKETEKKPKTSIDNTARLFLGNYEDRKFGVNDILTTLGVRVKAHNYFKGACCSYTV